MGVYTQRTKEGWRLISTEPLTDEEAGNLGFIVQSKKDVQLDDFVEVVDSDGTRIGHVHRLTCQHPLGGELHVLAEIELM